jgi:acyl carrier protein
MSHPNLDDQIRSIVADVLEIEPEEIQEHSSFVDDHDADSLGALEILARIEKILHVEIPQSDLPRMVDLAGVREVILEHAPALV